MNKQIIEKYGVSSIAKAIGETPQTINNWKYRGIPLEKAIDFCAAVNYEVTPHQLYPNNYPHPEDGLPPEFRCNCKDAA